MYGLTHGTPELARSISDSRFNFLPRAVFTKREDARGFVDVEWVLRVDGSRARLTITRCFDGIFPGIVQRCMINEMFKANTLLFILRVLTYALTGISYI